MKSIHLPIILFLLSSISSCFANDLTETFLKNYKSLLSLEKKIEHLENQLEFTENVTGIINKHIIPLVETSKAIHKSLKKNNFDIDDETKTSLEFFENTYNAYTELLKLLNAHLINLETKVALQELDI